MEHPMETGRRENSSGSIIPAHYITQVTVTLGDRELLAADWGPAISRNPFLSFQFHGGSEGESISISWVDNLGQTDSAQFQISTAQR